MLLAPHFLVGAAIATYAPNVPLGLGLAFLSHYLLDQVPHWHYFSDAEMAGSDHPLKKPIRPALASLMPLVRVATDIALGVTLALAFEPSSRFVVLLAGFLAMLPDGMLFLSWQFPRNRLLAWHQSIHGALHITPRNAPALPLGIPLQLGAALLAAFFLSPLGGML